MPKQKKNIELRVGIVSFLAIFLLIIGLVLGNGFSFSSKGNITEFRFDNAGGLQISEPVFVSGVEMGKITDIQAGENYVRVLTNIYQKIDFYNDASARILIKEIMGGKKIDVSPGHKSAGILQEGEPIIGRNTPDFGELVAIVGSVSEDAVSLIRKLDTLASSVNLFLSDTTFSTDVKYIASNTRKLVDNVNDVFSGQNGLRTTLKNANELITNLDNLVDKNSEDVTMLLKELRNTFASLDKTLSNANNTLSSLDPLIGKVDGLISDLQNENGLFHKISNDSELSKNLEQLIAELLAFVKQAKEYGVNVNASLGSNP
jgi:phospholipid/cholesterol/gamma-HCH transport system substrate-binding protein